MPAGPNQPICLHTKKPALSSVWKVYDLAGDLVAIRGFGSGTACWSPSGLAEGLYLVQLTVNYADGSREQRLQKIAFIK